MKRSKTNVGEDDARGWYGRPTRSVRADYKTLNKITLESHGSVRARTGVSTCATEDVDDVVDDVVARRDEKEGGEGEMCSRHDVDTSRKKGTAHVYSNPSYIAFSY